MEKPCVKQAGGITMDDVYQRMYAGAYDKDHGAAAVLEIDLAEACGEPVIISPPEERTP